VTNYISDNVSVLLGDGAGHFTASTPVPVTNGPREVAVGDLDGDGDIDFLATNLSGDNVTVALNNGNATFTTTSVAVGSGPRGLAVADLDGDGDLDFVAANYYSNTISVMLNNGNGVFSNATSSPIAVGTHPVDVALGDFNGDGKIDIAVTNNGSNTVSILVNDGSAGFTAQPTVPTGTGPRGVTAGDVDGDGDIDLVVTNFSAGTVSVLLNDGSGHFSAGQVITTGANPYRIALADLDGDGDLDMAVTNSGSSTISVFLNDGHGNFTPMTGSPFSVGSSPGGIVAGDFNGDGLTDLANVNFGSNTTSILLNNAPLVDLDTGASGKGSVTTFTEKGAAVAIGNAISVSDIDGSSLSGATIILKNATPGDVLTIAGSLPGGISDTIDTSVPGQITVHLTGSASLADYQTALGQIRFADTSDNPDTTDRDITVQLSNTDSGNIAHATVHVIAVDDAPVNAAPSSLSATVGQQSELAGLSVSDPDSSVLTTHLHVDNGVLNVGAVGGGAVISGNGSATVTLTGSVAQIDATLAAANNVLYHTNLSSQGTDHLTMTTSDGLLADTDTVLINVAGGAPISGGSAPFGGSAPMGGGAPFGGENFVFAAPVTVQASAPEHVVTVETPAVTAEVVAPVTAAPMGMPFGWHPDPHDGFHLVM
jgi:hypothetical protein